MQLAVGLSLAVGAVGPGAFVHRAGREAFPFIVSGSRLPLQSCSDQGAPSPGPFWWLGDHRVGGVLGPCWSWGDKEGCLGVVRTLGLWSWKKEETYRSTGRGQWLMACSLWPLIGATSLLPFSLFLMGMSTYTCPDITSGEQVSVSWVSQAHEWRGIVHWVGSYPEPHTFLRWYDEIWDFFFDYLIYLFI
jgi:hypothetical protein